MKRSNDAAGGNTKLPWRKGIIFWMFLALFGTCHVSSTGASGTASIPEPDLLEAQKAFLVTARLVSDNAVNLQYTIEPGYYMYRDRFRFSLNGQPIVVSRKAWPAGKWKQDPTFGRVVTYRKSVRLLLSIPAASRASLTKNNESLILTASSQGCADAGICYPPLHQTLALTPGVSGWVSPREETVSGFSPEPVTGKGLGDRLPNGK